MACRKHYAQKTTTDNINIVDYAISTPVVDTNVNRLLFGVDSKIYADDLLQNNIKLFDWIVRNKIYPNFYGRYLTGKDSLTKDEINFIHRKGCVIAPIYASDEAKETEKQGIFLANKVDDCVFKLGIREGVVIFLEINEHENITCEFMRGFAKTVMQNGFTPGFKANTDATFSFDREFSRGIQNDANIFKKCLIWATTPTIEEYNGITTSHLIHPDIWKPFAPSGIIRNEIAIWQYGINCHPIEDDIGKITTFNLDLVRNQEVLVEKLF